MRPVVFSWRARTLRAGGRRSETMRCKLKGNSWPLGQVMLIPPKTSSIQLSCESFRVANQTNTLERVLSQVVDPLGKFTSFKGEEDSKGGYQKHISSSKSMQ